MKQEAIVHLEIQLRNGNQYKLKYTLVLKLIHKFDRRLTSHTKKNKLQLNAEFKKQSNTYKDDSPKI